MKQKGESGQYLATNPPYGYKKDPENPKRWIVDEEAAAVVERIFSWCMEGYGPSQIARMLHEEHIEYPTAYWQRQGLNTPGKVSDDPYRWATRTVSNILERQEYLGHMINFKTHRQSYKNKRKIENLPEQRTIFRDSHEATLNDLVNAIYVHAPDESSGHRVQDITISYNYIGALPSHVLNELKREETA